MQEDNVMKIKTAIPAVLLAAFLAIPAIPVKAEETGYWKLIQGPVSEKGLEEYYGKKHDLSFVHDDNKRIVSHFRTTSYGTQADGHVEGHFSSTFSYAPERIGPEETIYIDMSTEVDNNMKNFLHSNSCNVYYGNMKFYRKSDDSNYGAELSISTGPNHVLSGSETVYYKIPAGKEAGEKMTILMETSQGQMDSGRMVGGISTTWNYEWVVEKKEDPTPTPAPAAKPGKGVIKSIKAKGKKVTVTVKAVNGTSSYQIRYKIGSSKKWKTVKKGAKNTFTVKASKGKKISVQARLENSGGTGAWGKTKSIKVK